MTKRFLFILLAVLGFQMISHGQYPSTIHNADLRVWLKSNLYDGEFSDLGYNSAREEMYSYVDEVGGKIHCIYTDFEMNASVTTYPNPINAEHLVPQSFFNGSSPMRSDLYNLRPSHQDANSARSHYDFDEIPNAQATWYGINSSGAYVSTSTEPSDSDDYSEGTDSTWEPQEDRKGDIARGIFYFYTMYPTQAGPITDLVDINTMYQWHLNDPADALEIQRNDRAEIAQGNRNPYVDYPNLAYDAWLWVEMLGCTDDAANNYDPEANTDDGSCEYGVAGCMDPLYLEFDHEAILDDGSCMTLKVYGCRYSGALNYDPLANIDDFGACVFSEPCVGDFNGDNNISALDLSMFLGVFSTTCN